MALNHYHAYNLYIKARNYTAFRFGKLLGNIAMHAYEK